MMYRITVRDYVIDGVFDCMVDSAVRSQVFGETTYLTFFTIQEATQMMRKEATAKDMHYDIWLTPYTDDDVNAYKARINAR